MNARDEAVEMIRRICPPHLDADEYGRILAGKFDAYRAEILAETATYFWGRRLARVDVVTDFDRGRRAAEGCVVEELRELAGQKATPAGEADPDFFVPGRTYTSTDRYKLTVRFVCEHTTTDPQDGEREAWGWLHRANGTRRMQRLWAEDYPNWTPEAAR